MKNKLKKIFKDTKYNTTYYEIKSGYDLKDEMILGLYDNKTKGHVELSFRFNDIEDFQEIEKTIKSILNIE